MADMVVAPPASGILGDVAACLAQGDLGRALELAEAGLRDPAQQRDAAAALAATAFRSGRLANAIRMLELAQDESATVSDVPEILAILNLLAGRLSDALYHAKVSAVVAQDGRLLPLFGPDLPKFTDAFLSPPRKPLFYQALSSLKEGQAETALDLLEQHLELFPNDVEALDAYSDALCCLGRARDAIGVLRSVTTLGGPTATLYSRLGRCLTDVGEFDQALACHAEALARAPKALPLLADALLDLSRHSHSAEPLRAQLAEAWTKARAETAPKTVRRAPEVKPKAKLCIGYLCAGALSGETREMLSRLALAHDRATVAVVGFGSGDLSQPTNIAFRGSFDRWIDVSPLDELTLSVMVRGEGVDVLVDVDGLLSPSRQGLFARNCAPVQLTWLNLPDNVSVPGSHGALAGNPDLGVGPLLLRDAGRQPAIDRSGRPLTFGADVRPGELTADVARVWSASLHMVPGSVLALRDHGYSGDPRASERLIDLFGNFGVAHRIEVVSSPSPAGFFNEIDIALAPFPAVQAASYGTALSLGVPVITLACGGQSGLLAQAVAASGFDAARMTAIDVAAYVAHAKAWAEDAAGRAVARAQAAQVVAASPVFNSAAYAAGLEGFYRDQLARQASA